MRTRRTPLAALLLSLSFLLAACGEVEVADAGSEPDAGSGDGTITVVDDQDREVTLDGPAERAVVMLSYNNEFVQAIGAGERVVGVDRVTTQRAPYLGFTEDDVVGEGIGELNYEAIVELDPDVAIIPRNGAWEEAEGRLAEFDIPVVVVSAWDFDIFDDTIALLGEVFGEPEGAEAVQGFYDEIFTDVTEAVAGTEEVPVYWETEQPYLTALPGSGFDQIITAAGGRNIFGDIAGGDAQHEITVDPAEVVQRDPAVIVHEMPPSAEPYTESQVTDLGAELLARPGWSGTTAAREGQVYVSNGWASSGLSKALGAAFLARWLHPEETADVDPGAYLERWATEFQGIPAEEYPGAEAYTEAVSP